MNELKVFFLNKERATESIGRARTSLCRIRLQRQTCRTAALFVLVWQLFGRWRGRGAVKVNAQACCDNVFFWAGDDTIVTLRLTQRE